MDTFNDDSLTPDQIKMLTLQFMGQHVTGELKELDKNLVNKTNTLKGMELNPAAVLNSISTAPIQQQEAAPTVNYTQAQPVPELPPTTLTTNTTVSAPLTPVAPVVQSTDTNQLEFSFETSPLSERIFEALERIEKKLSSIDDRLHALENTKKKD